MTSADHAGDDAAEALHGYPSIHGVRRRGRGTRHSGSSVVVSHGLQDGRHGAQEHAEEPGHTLIVGKPNWTGTQNGHTHSGQAELDWDTEWTHS